MKNTKKTFYELPLDSYNQPNGNVVEVQLTEHEFINRHPNRYIFRNRIDAHRRAQD